MGRIFKFLLTLSIVTYLIGPLSVMAQASTLDTSIGKFSISTIDISSDEIIEKLSTQPWWGNEELAKEFANLAKLNFGVQTFQACVGPSYTYELTDSSINEASWYQCGEGGKGISESGSLNIRGETNLSGVRTYAVATRIPDTNPRIDQTVVPKIPQQSLPRIVRSDGTVSKSSISIGGSSDNGDSYSTSYTVNDKIVLTAKIYPDEADVGKAGELYVVIRSKALGLKIFKALNEDGKWELWNGSLKKLPPAKTVDELQSMEEINIYSGYMTKGQRLIYVGYSLYTDGKPVITTSLTPLKIEVSE